MKKNDENRTTNKEQIKKKRKVKATGNNPDLGQDSEHMIDVIRAKVSPPRDYIIGPVPAEKHYDTFKMVEERLRARLKELPQDFYLTGLRVAYDVKDSSNEPGVLPYSIEFGPVALAEPIVQRTEPVEISDEELGKLYKRAPITVDLLDEFYDSAKGALEKAAGANLDVGIYIILSGNYPQIYAITCKCKRVSGKKKITTSFSITPNSTEERSYCKKGC